MNYFIALMVMYILRANGISVPNVCLSALWLVWAVHAAGRVIKWLMAFDRSKEE